MIDNHATHILQAKLSIEEIFKQTRGEIDDLKAKTVNLIKQETNSIDEVSKFLVTQIKTIQNNNKLKEVGLSIIKKKIDDIVKVEKEIQQKLSNSIEHYCKDEALNYSEKVYNDTKERKLNLNSSK